MLRSLTVPASWCGLLDTFRPAFRRSATFAVFALRATGLVAQAALRTVVGMLAGTGVARRSHARENPSRRADLDLRVWRACGSTVEITRSHATLRAMRQRPSLPSQSSAGSPSRPATSANSPNASAAAFSRSGASSPVNSASTANASLTRSDTRFAFAAEAGYRVRYTLASKLVNELAEAADDKQLTKLITHYGKVDLISTFAVMRRLRRV